MNLLVIAPPLLRKLFKYPRQLDGNAPLRDRWQWLSNGKKDLRIDKRRDRS
jgi:hypothetical protein